MLVGLITLHEYCNVRPVDTKGHLLVNGTPRCYLYHRRADAVPPPEGEHLKYAKICAISFYSASLLLACASGILPGVRAGPLKRSLTLYHDILCVWSAVYYTMDFLHLVPLVVSESDGMPEYGAMRIIVVWPVTSTLMISKIAVLCMMTRGNVPDSSLLEEDGDARGERDGADADSPIMMGSAHGEQDGLPNVLDGSEDVDSWGMGGLMLRPLKELMDRLELLHNLSQRVSGKDAEVMSSSWDVWFVFLVNNLMLLFGGFGVIASTQLMRVSCTLVSCGLFIFLMCGFRLLFEKIQNRVEHPHDKQMLKSLEYLSYVTWTLFPVIQGMRDLGFIHTSTQFLLMTAADIVAKMLYSINLIFSNFWLINTCDGLMRLDEGLFTDALELSRYSQLAATTLEKAKLEAESVSNLHRAFVANISHELRTPLNSIIAFNSLLLDDTSLTDSQREFVSSAIVSAEALLGIIGQILDFAKLESGSVTHQELVIESFTINDMLDELVDIVGHQANKNQVEMVVDTDPMLDGLMVCGDKFRLRQALINVTNNSIKYTREGGDVCVKVTSWVEEERPGRPVREPSNPRIASLRSGLSYPSSDASLSREQQVPGTPETGEEVNMPRVVVQFNVVDTGIGIAKDKLGVIFMPFGQASISSTREYGGTGLGLAITSNIMQRLSGTIKCTSELGRGTTMTLELPLQISLGARGFRGFSFLDQCTRQNIHYKLNNSGMVLSVVAKAALGAVIGRMANSGGAKHEHLESPFPHTEHQRRLWAEEIAHGIHSSCKEYEKGVLLVMEECYLAPIWTEWQRLFSNNPLAIFPPVILIVGTKMKVKNLLPAKGLSPSRRDLTAQGTGIAGGNSFNAKNMSGVGSFARLSMFDDDDSSGEKNSEEEQLTRVSNGQSQGRSEGNVLRSNSFMARRDLELGWQALLHSVVQVKRPVKPTMLKAALKKADAQYAEDASNINNVAAIQASRGVGRQPTQEKSAGSSKFATATPSRRVTRSSSRLMAEVAGDGEGGVSNANRYVQLRSTRHAANCNGQGDGQGCENGNGVSTLRKIPQLPKSGWAVRPPDGSAHEVRGNNGVGAGSSQYPPAVYPQLNRRHPNLASGRLSNGPVEVSPSPCISNETYSFVTAPSDREFLHGGKVLIVEDNLMNQKVAKTVVRHCGMTSELANNGKEAVDILKRGNLFDVILMDIQMPIMDGLEATCMIRQLEARGELSGRNYIIATSANATAENHQEGFAAGMDEYITKPIYPSKLKDLLIAPKRQMDDVDGEVTSQDRGRNE